LDHLCMAQCFAGDDIDPELVVRAKRLHDEARHAPTPDHPAIASGRLTLALTMKWTDNFDEAHEMLQVLREEHVAHGDEAALTPVLFHIGELECWCGEWQAAASVARELHDVGVRSEQPVAELRALTLDTMVACFRGDADAVAVGETSLAMAEHAGDWPAMIRILRAIGVHELSIGNFDAAVAHLVRGVAVERSSGYDQRTLRIMPDAIEALIAVDRREEASPLLQELETRGARSQRAWARSMCARCRGLMYAAAGDLDRAESALENAMLEHSRLPRPFERARTLLSLGAVQRRLRRQRVARESIEEARRVFDSLGATRWRDRAQAELDRVGGRASNPVALTPTEAQVAQLVADGATNSEVAGALFISVKTVEANLTRIYRKLGVSSRRDLARHNRCKDV
jgi:DNA-binding CsgD family transcriptional regulator